MKSMRYLITVLLLAFALHARAAIEVQSFATPAQRKNYDELTHEFRCLVCQNENIADSNADLAADLRHQIATMLRKGDDKRQIVAFMVARYGDFVLYKPPLKATTLLLWFGPALIALLGLFLLLRFIRRQAVQPATAEAFSPEERERLAALLNGDIREIMS